MSPRNVFHLYRIMPDSVDLVDTYLTTIEAVDGLTDDYLYDSRDGERYFVLNILTGLVVKNLIVSNVKKVVTL